MLLHALEFCGHTQNTFLKCHVNACRLEANSIQHPSNDKTCPGDAVKLCRDCLQQHQPSISHFILPAGPLNGSQHYHERSTEGVSKDQVPTLSKQTGICRDHTLCFQCVCVCGRETCTHTYTRCIGTWFTAASQTLQRNRRRCSRWKRLRSKVSRASIAFSFALKM